MKLYETYKDVITSEVWSKLESYLPQESLLTEVDATNINQLLSEANLLVFEAFGIKPSQSGEYFIAGSARLFKNPMLLKVLNQIDKSFPLVIGDLDIVVPDKEKWKTLYKNYTDPNSEFLKKLAQKIGEKNIEGVMNKFKEGWELLGDNIYRPGSSKKGLGLSKNDIEVFSEWKPQLAAVGRYDVNVRPTKEILKNSVQIGGYNYMSVRDVIDYKWQLGREKEKEILDLIGKYIRGIENLKPKYQESPEELEERKNRGAEKLFKNIYNILGKKK